MIKKKMIVLSVLACLSFLCLFLFAGQKTQPAFSGEEVPHKINFEKDRIFVNKGSFIRVDGQTLTIKEGGTYILKGRLSDGQVIVDAGEEEVKLKLNGVDLSNRSGSVILVKSAGKLKLRLRADSENLLSSDVGKACIYARSDISVKGEGSLEVRSGQGHGVFSSKDLRVKSGTLMVRAAKQALHGKKSVVIEQGKLDLKAGTDGIHSKGDLVVSGGGIRIDAQRYGMYAFNLLSVDKGVEPEIINALSPAGCHGRLEY